MSRSCGGGIGRFGGDSSRLRRTPHPARLLRKIYIQHSFGLSLSKTLRNKGNGPRRPPTLVPVVGLPGKQLLEGLDPLDGSTQVSTLYRHARVLASSRQNTEDRVLVVERGDALVAVVADGAGGVRGGAAASDTVISAVASAVASDGFDITDRISREKLLTDVDAQLARTMVGETTAVVIAVTSSGIIGMSVGDSEAWVFTETGIDDLTRAQNKKRLGSGRAVPVLFSRPPLEGMLVVASDGLWKCTSMERVAEVVRRREPAEAAEALRDLVALPSGKYQDDLGIVVLAPMGTSRA